MTDGKDSISLPILYAFGQGKVGQTYVLEYEGKYYESRVSFYGRIGSSILRSAHHATFRFHWRRQSVAFWTPHQSMTVLVVMRQQP
ncbi:MAG: hypothetical protein WKF84_15200 [Pyrinomonadaceae bacterium]